MSLVSVDVEADGPCPGLYSMVCFGAVIVEEGLTKKFYAKVKPISDDWIPEALAISGFSREDCLTFDDPAQAMLEFKEWLKENSKGHPVFISDNPAFDWQFINYYFHKYLKVNPFGFSARRIGDLYCGLKGDMFSKWKHLRITTHSHHPTDDAVGNAEAILAMYEMGLKGPKK